jgi:hypothetical protein
MTDEEDRRAEGLGRVSVRTLVEICGRDIGGAPAFEAEAVDVSGRGMHVRTAYLPEIGAPLVCRFEERGREIVVEGVVAWRKEEARGGEFGMKFTALDSGSVDALRDLCGMGESAEPEDSPEPAIEQQAPPRASQGSRVRLHIDGLGSPMKASVRDGGTRKVEVASNLEFLKVGRHLEIEDLTAGMRRGAQIDSVNVVIDPESRVPQLVVALRYDDADEATPEPSVIDNVPVTEGSPHAAMPMPKPMPLPMSGEMDEATASTDDPGDEEIAAAEVLPEDEIAGEAQALRSRFGAAAVSAGAAAKTGGVQLAKFGAAAAVGMGRLFKGAGEKVLELRRSRAADGAPKRTTAPPPGGALSVEGRRLRPQSTARPSAAEPETQKSSKLAVLAKQPRARKVAALSALAILVTTVGVLALKKAPPPGAGAEAPSVSVAVAASGEPIEVDDQGNPIEKAAADEKPKKLGEPAGDEGVSADVPLFGPTPMATMEPAPLDAPPEGGEAAEAGEEAAEKEKASVADELWPEEGGGDKADTGAEKKANPSDVPPWGRGKLDTPIVHRLRLDGPGGAIQGAVNATGFTVVIPDRKVMESGSGIEQRDSRIARVKTRNGTSGAQISFQFKDGVPGYRVRLRKDYVEFLISSEGSKSSTATVKSTGTKKSGSKSKSSKTRSESKKDKSLSTSSGKSAKNPKKKRNKKKSD